MNLTHNPPTEPDITPAEVLHCAALYLYRHGWHQGDMVDTAHPNQLTPPACVQGAVKMAICGNPHATYTLAQAALFDRTLAVLAYHLFATGHVTETAFYGALCDTDAEIVASWNDNQARILTEVITALDTAADEWTTHHTTTRGGAAVADYAVSALTLSTLDAVQAEAVRAHHKHGPKSLLNPDMPVAEKLAALVEEVGEVGRALTYDKDHSEGLVKELIQVASVALSWVESIEASADTTPGGAT